MRSGLLIFAMAVIVVFCLLTVVRIMSRQRRRREWQEMRQHVRRNYSSGCTVVASENATLPRAGVGLGSDVLASRCRAVMLQPAEEELEEASSAASLDNKAV